MMIVRGLKKKADNKTCQAKVRLLFVHVPKTAGTSLRRALHEYYGRELLCDYGAESTVTEPVMRQHQLDHDQRVRFVMRKSAICGHFPLDRYSELYDPREIVSFVRAPLQQLQSHYAHFKRINGYTGSLEEFAQSSHGLGLQSRFFRGCPPQLLGYVGTTENYEGDLVELQRLLGIPLSALGVNRNPDKISAKYKYPGDGFASAKRPELINDRLLHARAARTASERKKLDIRHDAWVHAAIVGFKPRSIEVAAYHGLSSRREGPVRIRVHVNNEVNCVVVCDRPLTTPLPIRLPCQGRIGADLCLSNGSDSGSVIELYDAETDQWLDGVRFYHDSVRGTVRPGPLIE